MAPAAVQAVQTGHALHRPAPLARHPAAPVQTAISAALLDAAAPIPAGLGAWNGSDPDARFAVYRNNVVHSLVAVLADTFPVVQQLVGEAFFAEMARCYVLGHPPTSPLMHRYGAHYPAWIAGFEPAAPLPYLSDVARLEWLRLCAFHAADAQAIDSDAVSALIAAPERLLRTVFTLHPSVAIVASSHPVVSLWAAHQFDEAQRDERLGALSLADAEAALVFRDAADDALVLPLAEADAALLATIASGRPLGAAQAAHPSAHLVHVLSLLLQHGLVSEAVDTPLAEEDSKPCLT
jgi:hypothetical protein